VALSPGIDQLADAIADAMLTVGRNRKAAWRKAIRMLIEYLIKNAVVTGAAPSGGGPIVEGKIT
jgi:hypothetical protein